ncbi:MAG: hypothetical protein AAF432_10155 [Planctomycetota bacterium]
MVVIPTNVPVVRADHNDLVFISEKDKWDAVVDEVKSFHDVGRPVLVGTTSVERSDMLSQMLGRKHNIDHEVLNAKQHEREADIVLSAGQVGAVMIATNMAGRGTDIKLGQFTREELVDHWKRRGICPKAAQASQSDDEIIAAIHRHLAGKELGMKKGDLESKSDEEIRLALLRHWALHHTYLSESKIAGMNARSLEEELDDVGSCLMHRLRFFENVEELGGLHVIGTERHESRRIDNQLRGRSGRQGDNGSSRFYVSLEDPLMKMFAGETTLKLLSRLGMKEGDAIENPMLTKAIGRAQRKVEERNFLSRKNLLEWDEVLNAQRMDFYEIRQAVLEGRGVKDMIFEHIEDSVRDAVDRFLAPAFQATCIAEWVRENMGVSVEPDRFRGKDREDLHRYIRIACKEEAASMIEVTIGEYMPTDINLGKGTIERADRSMWNLSGLCDWAKATFNASLRVSDIQDMEPKEVVRLLEDAATKHVETQELGPLDQYLVPRYGATELCKWTANKFDAEFKPEEFDQIDNLDDAFRHIMTWARDRYTEREILYPIDFAVETTSGMIQHDAEVAITQFTSWVRARYELDWSPHALPSSNPTELRDMLIAEAKKWDESRRHERADRAVQQASTPDALSEWFQENMGARLTESELERAVDDPRSVAIDKIDAVMRAELAQLERFILLQIIDNAWKDHLHSIDQLRESIGFRSFSQRDPRIEFKREGAGLYEEMWSHIRERVTELAFKAKLTPQFRAPAPPAGTATQPEAQRPTEGAPGQPGGASGAAASGQATATAAPPAERTNRGAAPPKRPPVRAAAAIGRNEMVTIQNPATGEKETVKYKKAEGKLKTGWQIVGRES